MTQESLRARLEQTVRRGKILTAPAQLAGYDADGLGFKSFPPDAVVIPADRNELVELLQRAPALGVPLCMRGAGTSLSGGPVAAQGGIVVHTSALRQIPRIEAEGLWCEVESGVTLNHLNRALEPHGVFYPPDPSSGPVCTIGGNVAMNAGGAHCFRYGVTSHYVLGVEVVLTDGSVHQFGGPAGDCGDWSEDWKRLMVGSEGTLGAFTRFWLRLTPIPEKAWTFRAIYPDLQTTEKAIHALVAHSSFPVAIELMDPRCVAMVENSPMAVGLPKDRFLIVAEIDGPEILVDQRVDDVRELLLRAGAEEVELSDDDQLREKLWRARKVAGGLMGQLSPDLMVQDAVIPKRALAEVLQLAYDEADAAGLETVSVFHAGDGNLHPNVLFDSRIPGQTQAVEQIGKRLMNRVVEVGGTLSGEHGIGNDKMPYMPLVFDQRTTQLQSSVPAAFCRDNQLNPLKVFSSRQFARNELGNTDGGPPESQQARNPRLFEPFVDEIDAVACVSAQATYNEIQELLAPYKLRFPHFVDAEARLLEQVESCCYMPAASRFGSIHDNVIGMNWRLPSGEVVRIGERVVKSTTGYDLQRFLLRSSSRFGVPQDYVLRLRREFEATVVGRGVVPVGQLPEIRANLLQSCWVHWFDSIEFEIESPEPDYATVKLVFNCPEFERSIYEDQLRVWSQQWSTEIRTEDLRTASLPGCPDIELAVTPDLACELASEVKLSIPMRWTVQVVAGRLHGYSVSPPAEQQSPRERRKEIAQRVRTELKREFPSRWQEILGVGGGMRPHQVSDEHRAMIEERWLETMLREFSSNG